MLNLSNLFDYLRLTLNTFPEKPNALEGEACVETAIQPGKAGRIKFQGSFWAAECTEPLTFLPGEIVYVDGLLRGNTLQIRASQLVI